MRNVLFPARQVLRLLVHGLDRERGGGARDIIAGQEKKGLSMKTTIFSFARKLLASGAILLTAGWMCAAAQDPSGTGNNQDQQNPSGTSRQEARDTAKEKIDAAKEQKQG